MFPQVRLSYYGSVAIITVEEGYGVSGGRAKVKGRRCFRRAVARRTGAVADAVPRMTSPVHALKSNRVSLRVAERSEVKFSGHCQSRRISR